MDTDTHDTASDETPDLKEDGLQRLKQSLKTTPARLGRVAYIVGYLLMLLLAILTYYHFIFVSNDGREVYDHMTQTSDPDQDIILQNLIDQIVATDQRDKKKKSLSYFIKQDGVAEYKPKRAMWQLRSRVVDVNAYTCEVVRGYPHGRLTIRAELHRPVGVDKFLSTFELGITHERFTHEPSFVKVHLHFDSADVNLLGYQSVGSAAAVLHREARDMIRKQANMWVTILPKNRHGNRSPKALLEPLPIKEVYVLKDSAQALKALFACVRSKPPPLDDLYYPVIPKEDMPESGEP